MKFFKYLASLIAVFAIVGCSRIALVHNYEQQSVPTGLTQQQVGKAITECALNREWIIESNTDGAMNLKINVRTHMAAIKITYNKSFYSINYVDSYNLKYDGHSIHRNYNKWVTILNRDIQQKLSAMAFDAK